MAFSFVPEGFRKPMIEVGARLWILRRMFPKDHSRNTGRIEGRQAPTTPREDSTIDQQSVGVKMSETISEKPHRCTNHVHTRHVIIVGLCLYEMQFN